jgi:hypothetical protein
MSRAPPNLDAAPTAHPSKGPTSRRSHSRETAARTPARRPCLCAVLKRLRTGVPHTPPGATTKEMPPRTELADAPAGGRSSTSNGRGHGSEGSLGTAPGTALRSAPAVRFAGSRSAACGHAATASTTGSRSIRDSRSTTRRGCPPRRGRPPHLEERKTGGRRPRRVARGSAAQGFARSTVRSARGSRRTPRGSPPAPPRVPVPVGVELQGRSGASRNTPRSPVSRQNFPRQREGPRQRAARAGVEPRVSVQRHMRCCCRAPPAKAGSGRAALVHPKPQSGDGSAPRGDSAARAKGRRETLKHEARNPRARSAP